MDGVIDRQVMLQELIRLVGFGGYIVGVCHNVRGIPYDTPVTNVSTHETGLIFHTSYGDIPAPYELLYLRDSGGILLQQKDLPYNRADAEFYRILDPVFRAELDISNERLGRDRYYTYDEYQEMARIKEAEGFVQLGVTLTALLQGRTVKQVTRSDKRQIRIDFTDDTHVLIGHGTEDLGRDGVRDFLHVGQYEVN